jgi:hypothetical protein
VQTLKHTPVNTSIIIMHISYSRTDDDEYKYKNLTRKFKAIIRVKSVKRCPASVEMSDVY